MDAPRKSVFGAASALNPAAGNFPVTTDPRALAAVQAAGARSFERFPYIVARYGERGRAFTTSDGAWLVTVAAEPPAGVAQHVGWLAGLLATRGLPRRILEIYLPELAAALDEHDPDMHEQWARLTTAGRTLAEARRAHVDDAALDSLVAWFARRRPAVAGHELTDAAELVGSAFADEAAGFDGAVEALMRWLADPAHFAPEWIAAVRELERRARDLVRPGPDHERP